MKWPEKQRRALNAIREMYARGEVVGSAAQLAERLTRDLQAPVTKSQASRWRAQVRRELPGRVSYPNPKRDEESRLDPTPDDRQAGWLRQHRSVSTQTRNMTQYINGIADPTTDEQIAAAVFNAVTTLLDNIEGQIAPSKDPVRD